MGIIGIKKVRKRGVIHMIISDKLNSFSIRKKVPWGL